MERNTERSSLLASPPAEAGGSTQEGRLRGLSLEPWQSVRHVAGASFRVATLTLLSLAPSLAAAHPLDVGALHLTIEEGRVEESLFLSTPSLALLLPPDKAPQLGSSAEELAPLLGPVFEATLGRSPLKADGAPCALAASSATPEGIGVRLLARGSCPAKAHTFGQRLGFLEGLPPTQRILVQASIDGAPQQRVADVVQPGFELRAGERRGWFGFVALGVEHIFTGYDHLVFLLCLLLAGGTVRRLAAVVSAFTLAHSITLALAALSLVSLPSRLVECAIAASIMYVALENFLATGREHRWFIALLFGLVHGFGFASALREAHLSRNEIVGALVGFNAGVELGQLAIVLAVAPLLALARRRRPFEQWGIPGLSLASLALGAYWFVGWAF